MLQSHKNTTTKSAAHAHVCEQATKIMGNLITHVSRETMRLLHVLTTHMTVHVLMHVTPHVGLVSRRLLQSPWPKGAHCHPCRSDSCSPPLAGCWLQSSETWRENRRVSDAQVAVLLL